MIAGLHPGQAPILPIERARVFFDGTFSSPRLAHPECVAVGPDGHIWCGTETGDIVRIAPDGSGIEKMATTGGFILGLAFDRAQALFACDWREAAVFRLDLATGHLARFSAPGIRIPNYPLVDHAARRLFVSDSHDAGGIWAYDLQSGAGHLWHAKPMQFANGLAMRSGEAALYACETFARAITRIPILADGTAGTAAPFASDLPGLPDGIAFDAEGRLVVGCYEPSRLLRISGDGRDVQILLEDPSAHLLCHPTNIAFHGKRLFTANLGRWHVTEVAMDTGAPALWEA